MPRESSIGGPRSRRIHRDSEQRVCPGFGERDSPGKDAGAPGMEAVTATRGRERASCPEPCAQKWLRG